MKKKMTPLKRVAASLAVAAACAVTSAPAFAYEGDPWFRQWQTSVFAQFQMNVQNQFYAINEFMNAIRIYLTTGEGDTGTGLIGTIQKTQDANRFYGQEEAATNHARNQVLAMNQAMANRVASSIPDPRDCDELPQRVGARAGGGGGGSMVSKGRTEAKAAANAAGTLPSPTAHAAAVYGNHQAGGYCAAEDINYSGAAGGSARNAFNCTTPGAMPDGDARAQSVFVPAHDYVNASAATRMSLTYDGGQTPTSGPSQAAAADDSINNIVSRFSPAAMPKNIEQSPQGRIVLAKQKVFNARLSPAINALAGISSRRNASANAMSTEALAAVWDNSTVQGVYDRVFSGAQHPKKPSEMEVIRYEVMRRYADYGVNSWITQVTNEADPAKRSLAQIQNQAVELNLLYQIHGRLEENNALQSAILAQLMNPVTKADIELNSQAASQNN